MGQLAPNNPQIARRSDELTRHCPYRVESHNEQRDREKRHREMPKDEQPYMVVFFGMLSYGVMWVGQRGGHLSTAEAELAWWQEQCKRGLYIPGYTREPHPSDFQVRQQWDLDDLTRAILDSYQ